MAYDEHLGERARDALLRATGDLSRLSERKMFGGLCLMVDGHMTCGIVGGDLMLRLGEPGTREALERPHVRPMDFTGTPSKGMVYVAQEGLRGRALAAWVGRALAFVESLPPKQPRRSG